MSNNEKQTKGQWTAVLITCREAIITQTYNLSHFLTTKSMAFSIKSTTTKTFTTACRSRCQAAEFRATPSFSHSNNYNNTNTHLKTLANTHLRYELFHLAAFFKRRCRYFLSRQFIEGRFTHSQPFMISQWSNTLWGKAWPAVCDRSSPLKPNDSATGK